MLDLNLICQSADGVHNESLNLYLSKFLPSFFLQTDFSTNIRDDKLAVVYRSAMAFYKHFI